MRSALICGMCGNRLHLAVAASDHKRKRYVGWLVCPTHGKRDATIEVDHHGIDHIISIGTPTWEPGYIYT